MQESAGLGALLRECREVKGLSVDDLSRATRIVPRQILALEEDRLRDLPAPVFVRGFIRSYCRAVAESPERALALYDSWVATTQAPTPQVPATVLADPPAHRGIGWRGLASRLLLAALLIVIGGVVYLLASSAATRSIEVSRVTDEAAVPGGRPPEAATAPGPDPAMDSAGDPVKRPPVSVAPPEAGAHVLVMRAHESTWVSVRPGDGAAGQELLEAGSVREWRSPGRFTITVGNAGGLTLELDGVALPPLGEHGQVVRDLRIPRELAQ